MKVQSINSSYSNYYNQNNSKKINRNQSFGNIEIGKQYRSLLDDSELEEISSLCQKEINVKKLIDYENLSPTRKAAADKYLAAMQKAKINTENLTVYAGAKNETNLGIGSTASADVFAKFSVPILPLVKDGNIDYGSFSLQVDGLAGNYCVNKRAMDYEEKRQKEKQKLYDNVEKIGFKLPYIYATPIPTEKIFDLIANKINEEIDKLEKITDI